MGRVWVMMEDTPTKKTTPTRTQPRKAVLVTEIAKVNSSNKLTTLVEVVVKDKSHRLIKPPINTHQLQHLQSNNRRIKLQV